MFVVKTKIETQVMKINKNGQLQIIREIYKVNYSLQVNIAFFFFNTTYEKHREPVTFMIVFVCVRNALSSESSDKPLFKI